MEDSVPDVEELCANLMADEALLTERVKAEGCNFNPAIEQIYYQRLAQSSGQAQVSVIRGRMKFLQRLLVAAASRVAPPSPALALTAPLAASKIAPTTATSAVKAESELSDQSDANRAASSSSKSGMKLSLHPGVSFRHNASSVMPLPAPALVATPSDASKLVKAESELSDQSDANRAASSSSMSEMKLSLGMKLSLNPSVKFRHNASSVMPLPAPALVATPSDASKLAPSVSAVVKVETTEAVQSSVRKRNSHGGTKYNAEQQTNVLQPIHVAFAHFAVNRLRQHRPQTQAQLINAWNSTHAPTWVTLLDTAMPQIYKRASGRACNFFNNGIFKILDLQAMAWGTLSLPVPQDNLPDEIYRAIQRSGSEGALHYGDGGGDGGDAAVGGADAGLETIQPASGGMDWRGGQGMDAAVGGAAVGGDGGDATVGGAGAGHETVQAASGGMDRWGPRQGRCCRWRCCRAGRSLEGEERCQQEEEEAG